MKTTFRMTVLLVGLAFLLGGGLACEKVDWGLGKDKDSPNPGRMNKSRAIDIAERVAKNEKLNPENYEANTREVDGAWWVLFDHKLHGYKLGFPYHFAVHVTPDGKSVLFKNR